jgi:hypothetical protein
MTPGLIVSRRKKNELFKVSLVDPSEINKTNYKTYRNLHNKLVRINKKNHVYEKIEKSTKNPKKMWETLKEFTAGKKTVV